MKYVRTKDGRVVDVEKFINEEKDTPYYKDFEFEEISKDGELKWTAIGTDQNSIEDQRGKRCQFSATLNSEIVAEADTIPEVCDEFVCSNEHCINHNYTSPKIEDAINYKDSCEKFSKTPTDLFAAIWTNSGLIYKAKMKGILPNGEIDWELL